MLSHKGDSALKCDWVERSNRRKQSMGQEEEAGHVRISGLVFFFFFFFLQ